VFIQYLNRNILLDNEAAHYGPIAQSLRKMDWSKDKFPYYFETIVRKIHESTKMDFFLKSQLPYRSKTRGTYQFITGSNVFVHNNDVKHLQAILKMGNLIGFEKALILFRRQI